MEFQQDDMENDEATTESRTVYLQLRLKPVVFNRSFSHYAINENVVLLYKHETASKGQEYYFQICVSSCVFKPLPLPQFLRVKNIRVMLPLESKSPRPFYGQLLFSLGRLNFA